MAAALVTIKIQASIELMERIRANCQDLDVTPASFIEYAIESELRRQESQQRTEQAAVDQLREAVLSSGQSVTIHDDLEGQSTCQLCLRVIEKAAGVEGPLLCDSCYQLAQIRATP